LRGLRNRLRARRWLPPSNKVAAATLPSPELTK